MVNAAVVQTWGSPPTYQPIELPPPSPTQHRITILSVGLHNLVRSRASGSHFSVAHTTPPHIPGTDGVGTLPTGELVYFNCLTSPTGSFATEINVEKKDFHVLPERGDVNVEMIAVLANPAMSSWMAITTRVGKTVEEMEGLSVAVLGATGVSGSAAIQILKAMGVKTVIAVGKPGEKLERTKELGASQTVELKSVLKQTDFSAAKDVDIVLDYLWGDVAKAAVEDIVAKRTDKTKRLTWIEIGALAGDDFAVSAALLRKANVVFLGCGPGSWSFKELGEQTPGMLRVMVENKLRAEYVVKRLADVETWWDEKEGPRVLVKP